MTTKRASKLKFSTLKKFFRLDIFDNETFLKKCAENVKNIYKIVEFGKELHNTFPNGTTTRQLCAFEQVLYKKNFV